MSPADQAEIDLAVRQLTALLIRHLPGLVTSLNLVGSAVDGDFRAGRSDLDFVAVLGQTPADDTLEGLTIVHRLYAADPTLTTLDGIWLTKEDLVAGPDAAADGPSTESGVFLGNARGNRNPVTWFTLRDKSQTILGELDRANLWHDTARLMSWTRENVESYWLRWHARANGLWSRAGLAMLGTEAPAWGVLGISRLHYTLATGSIASKTQAGEHALTAFEPRWHRIVNESLRIRRGEPGSLYSNPFVRRREALDYVSMVIGAIRGKP